MKNLKVNKTMAMLGLSFSLVASSLTGCENNRNKEYTVEEYLLQADNFDLLSDKNKLIIQTENPLGESDIIFAEKISFNSICNPNYSKFTDSDEYEKYFGVANTDNTYLYFNIFSGNLVSVKYIEKDNHLFKPDKETISYALADVISEELAYNYAASYLGEQDSYTREEISAVIDAVKSNKNAAMQKTK